MRNNRYILGEGFEAKAVSDALRLQLDVNRMDHINVVAIEKRNEVIVQVPEASGDLEKVIESFMSSYQTQIIQE
ncbi:MULTISPECIES: hypothetical protein [unclassified Bacillus (in: firmicutes)]|uniref:hypothetical protein n=1 Tax=unclassified Bacillus (in: firmicutes) TaxID=185979 RepID=UPI001BE89559|nr:MULTISPECIES: hypothetical protein [unclassified Bacillus (in: firmicutes)]MBT2637891.1 hypothetical protein [Bacillus sp. ISL-39]MBT2661064.1 hypothetical protein [Bacillus sp. ISL-45]